MSSHLFGGDFLVLRILTPLPDSNAAAYSSDGFSTGFLVGEYVMGIAMEFLSCILLLGTHFSALNGGHELQEDYAARDHDKLADDGGELVVRGSEVKGEVEGDIKGSEA